MTDDRSRRSEEQPEGRSEEKQPRIPIRVRDRRVTSGEPEPDETEQGAGAEDETRAGAEDETGAEAAEDSAARELEEAQQLAAERLDQLMRLKADFENYRKRVIREQTEVVDRASLRVVERLLEVLDDFDRALDAARAHEGAEGIVRGMELVYNRLMDILRSEGLERLEAEGHAFDPADHEAIGSQTGDVAEPTVLEVVRPGYRMKGKTVRPALVHVTTPPEEAEESEEGRDQ